MTAIKIDENTITFPKGFIQISTLVGITEVTVASCYKKAKKKFGESFGVLLGSFVITGMIGAAELKNLGAVVFLFGLLGFVICFLYSIYLFVFQSGKKIGLVLLTSSGEIGFAISKYRKPIEKIATAIKESMNSRGSPVNFNMNLKNVDIINQSGNFENGIKY